jgi:hypothetical protein
MWVTLCRGLVRYYGQQYAVTTKVATFPTSTGLKIPRNFIEFFLAARPPSQQLVRQFWKLFKLIVSNILCFLSLLFILSWNAGNIGYHNYTVPHDFRWIAWFLHLDQSWR